MDRQAQEQLVYQGICEIAARCDGAVHEDFVGFNGQDTKFGRRIAQIPFAQWTPEIKSEAARLVGRTYREQAKAYTDVWFPDLDVVQEALSAAGEYRTVEERSNSWTAREQARAAERARTAKSKRIVTLDGDELVFTFPFDASIKDELKAAGRGAFRFNGQDKSWRIHRDALNTAVVGLTVTYEFNVRPEAEEALEAASDVAPIEESVGTVVLGTPHLVLNTPHRITITLTGQLGPISFHEYRQLQGYSWERRTNRSTADPTPANLDWLEANEFSGVDEVRTALAPVIAEQTKTLAASRSADSDLDLSPYVPAGLTPYPFQVAGVEYAIGARRTFIADEMGLGKTVQAILTVKATDSFPAVVVCPASLKGNWAKEITRWDPTATVQVLSGRSGSAADFHSLKNRDWVIVNYDIIDGRGEELAAIRPQALVIDESHYVKNEAAKRTKAITKLAEQIPTNGVVLCLTGTPILNRPNEIVTQLNILGRLADIAPASRKSTYKDLRYSFLFRYCGPKNNGYGWEFKGVSNAQELNTKLRSTCFIRREREEVLDLKATHRTIVPLSLNGELKDYRRAEADVIAYIREELGTKAAQRAKQAEILVQLNLLRRLAEEAKISSVIEWVNDWLESYPTKKLVVFAGHISVQRALVEAFNCPHILGGEKDAENQKALFQDGDARVIVCSLQAAREGHTLTAASDVVFTSLGWTPGGLQQAEDRCNRIGQEADQVVAWQLLADDTIDEQIGELIEAKRAVFNAVINGTDDDEGDSILEGVVDYLRSR